MTQKLLLVLPALVLHFLQVTAQPSDSVWIETSNLRICLRNDGSLYSGAPGGAIQFRQETENGDKWITVVKEAALWMGGIEPAGNLMLSIPQQASPVRGFSPGIAGVPNSGKIWQVKYEEVAEHLRDYAADGVIDHPIENIFSWPGRGNRFSKEFNGFIPQAIPFLSSAPFVKRNSWYVDSYQPDKGDYPHFTGYHWWPDQLYGYAFESVSQNDQFPLLRFPIQGWCFAYTINCPSNQTLNNTLFLNYIWHYRDTNRADSCIAGFYINPDIGNPDDDYHGSHNLQDIYFAFNADSLDEGGFSEKAPFLSVQIMHSPLDTFGSRNRLQVMPVGPSEIKEGNPAYMAFPELPLEYYRYLTCSWKDGRPLTIGGDGYGQEQITTLAYPGNPFLPGIWSELNSGNLPGDRRAVLSYAYGSALPTVINRLSLMISVTPPSGAPASEDFETMRDQVSRVGTWFSSASASPATDPAISCVQYPYLPFSRYIVRAYPNPADDVLYIQVEERLPRTIQLFDCFQRLVREINFPFGSHAGSNPIELPVRDLPPGMYFLEANSWETIETVAQKVLIIH